MAKRILLFVVTNLLIMATLSIALTLLSFTPLGPVLARASGAHLVPLALFCLIWGMAGAFISLGLSRIIAKFSMGVQIVDPNAPGAYAGLVERIARHARTAGLPMPEVGVYESPEPNAFATGPTRKRSLVAVSTGLLQQMTPQEVDGVLAHEITHIANGDMVTMTLVQGVVNAFAMFLSRVIAYLVGRMVDEKIQGLVRFGVTIALDIVFSILGALVVCWFSRRREFRADAGGARLAGRDNMIAGLARLQQLVNGPEDERGAALATLKISNRRRFSFFATHPPLEERIRVLQDSAVR
ncbi:MAG: protease HtpX [Lentisphaeria bacterium]